MRRQIHSIMAFLLAAFTARRARLFGYDLFPLVIARDLAMCAIDMIPALKRALVRQAMGFGGPLPRLGRGIPL